MPWLHETAHTYAQAVQLRTAQRWKARYPAHYTHGLSLAIVEYQTAVLCGDIDAATELLAEDPAKHKKRVARVLEAQGKPRSTVTMNHTGRRLETTRPRVLHRSDHRFDVAHSSTAEQTPAPENEIKW